MTTTESLLSISLVSDGSSQLGSLLLDTDKRIVAMDGVAKSGKGTLASMLAQHYGLLHVDSGSIYRSVALLALERNIELTDASSLAELVLQIPEEMLSSSEIRTSEISRIVPRVSLHREVRAQVNIKQFLLVETSSRGAVIEGRDIANKVFPNAHIKIFITATSLVRAERELRRLGVSCSLTLQEIESAILLRDHEDMTRKVDPLVKHPDAFLLDTTHVTQEEMLRAAVAYIDGQFSNF